MIVTFLSLSIFYVRVSKITQNQCKLYTFTTRLAVVVIATVAISWMFSLFFITFNVEIPMNIDNVFAQSQQQQQQQQQHQEPEQQEPVTNLLSSVSPSSSQANKITIYLNSVKFAPLMDVDYNQLKILADYQTNDPSLVNTPLLGTMDVYLPDGTHLRSSSFLKGFILSHSGSIQFATLFTNKTIQQVTADIYLTDNLNKEKISNTLQINTSLTN